MCSSPLTVAFQNCKDNCLHKHELALGCMVISVLKPCVHICKLCSCMPHKKIIRERIKQLSGCDDTVIILRPLFCMSHITSMLFASFLSMNQKYPTIPDFSFIYLLEHFPPCPFISFSNPAECLLAALINRSIIVHKFSGSGVNKAGFTPL